MKRYIRSNKTLTSVEREELENRKSKDMEESIKDFIKLYTECDYIKVEPDRHAKNPGSYWLEAELFDNWSSQLSFQNLVRSWCYRNDKELGPINSRTIDHDSQKGYYRERYHIQIIDKLTFYKEKEYNDYPIRTY